MPAETYVSIRQSVNSHDMQPVNILILINVHIFESDSPWIFMIVLVHPVHGGSRVIGFKPFGWLISLANSLRWNHFLQPMKVQRSSASAFPPARRVSRLNSQLLFVFLYFLLFWGSGIAPLGLPRDSVQLLGIYGSLSFMGTCFWSNTLVSRTQTTNMFWPSALCPKV